jgi:general secretion pathway protein B
MQQQPAPQAQAPAPVAAPFQSGASRTGAGAPAAASSATQPPVKALPADAPRIVLSGGVYSPKASQRMVIANGQVVREGAEIASGVVLEEVRPESAVLGFRGNRYNVFF